MNLSHREKLLLGTRISARGRVSNFLRVYRYLVEQTIRDYWSGEADLSSVFRPPIEVPHCFYYFQNDVYNPIWIPGGRSCNSRHGTISTRGPDTVFLLDYLCFSLTKLSNFLQTLYSTTISKGFDADFKLPL